MNSFNLKEGVSAEELLMLQPAMLFLLGNITFYCYTNKLPLTITSITGHVDGRVSRSHEEGRAVDMRIRDWKKEDILKMVKYFNKKFKSIAAISSRDGVPRAAVYGDSRHLDHVHWQVRPHADINKVINAERNQ